MWNNKNSIEDMIIFEDKDILVCHKLRVLQFKMHELELQIWKVL